MDLRSFVKANLLEQCGNDFCDEQKELVMQVGAPQARPASAGCSC